MLTNLLIAIKFPTLSSCIRTISSALLIAHLSGPATLFYAVSLTVLFLILGHILREHRLLIAVLIGLIMFFLDEILSLIFKRGFPSSSPVMFSVIKSAHLTCYLRAGSVALTACTIFKTSSKRAFDKTTLRVLVDSLEYALLPYTFYFGPLITYEDWLTYRSRKITVQGITRAKQTGRLRPLTWSSLLGRAGRLIFWFHFWSLSLCFVYPVALFRYITWSNLLRPASRTNPWDSADGLQLSNFAMFTAVQAVGLHYYIFHLFLYGVPGLLADIEHFLSLRSIPVLSNSARKCPFSRKEQVSSCDKPSLSKAVGYDSPPELCLVVAPPSCVLHIALFSEMWRTFDRGLYGFMRCHIYEPLLDASATGSVYWNRLIRCLAFTVPFLFVLLYHSVLVDNVLWTIINLLSFSLEIFFKWLFRNTSHYSEMHIRFSPYVTELMTNIWKVCMWLLSLYGFIVFLFGTNTALCFANHVILTTHMLLNLLLYVCGLYFVATARRLCGYQGFPVSFNRHNILKSVR